MTYDKPEYLIQADQLATAVAEGSDALRIFDATVFLHPDPPRYRVESGLENYQAAHVPGAGFLDLTGDLSDADSPLGFTLPSADALVAGFGRAGISSTSRVVLYSSGHLMWATRVWWMLHSLGHPSVAVLDGGLRAWTDAGHATETGLREYPAGNLTGSLNQNAWADTSRVQAAIDDVSICTVNALSDDVYQGNGPINYGRPGHIAGSRSLPYDALLDRGRMRSAQELSTALDAKGILNAERVICYCGGGISATIDAFALALLGRTNVAVYDGSMSAWASDPALPMEQGPDTSAPVG